MEYKEVPKDRLVSGQRYYIVPVSRLITNGLVAGAVRGKLVSAVKPVPEGKKKTIFLLSGVADVKIIDKYYTKSSFHTFWNKDNAPSKDTRKADETYYYYSFEPTPYYNVKGSTVTAKDVTETVGEFAPNTMPVSVRNAPKAEENVPAVTAVTVAAAPAELAPVLRTPMTPAVKKTTDELIIAIKSGEGRISISDILKRKNTPQLDNIENHNLVRGYAIKILPDEFPLPPPDYYYRETLSVGLYSVYGAIELLIEANRYFTQEQQERYIHDMVRYGADPSRALVTAIVNGNMRIVNLLLDLGADPNYVQEYKSIVGAERFLTTPLLAAIPTTRFFKEFSAFIMDTTHVEKRKALIQSLTKIRTFVEQDGRLVLADRDSLPEGTPILDRVAYLTPKVLDRFREQLADLEHAMAARKTLSDANAYKYKLLPISWYEKYQEFLKWAVRHLNEEAERQAPLLAEPGGPLYEEVRARAYGRTLGTREEQVARNAAANAAVRNLMASKPASGGGSRKRSIKRKRQTRRQRK